MGFLGRLTALAGSLFLSSGVARATTPNNPTKNDIQERVAEVRRQLRLLADRDLTEEAIESDSAKQSGEKLAQWYNWPNWRDWRDWPNWGNWYNY